MGNRDESKQKQRVESVLQLLKKQAPLTVKQEKFCNDACVERFLMAKGESVKRAAKQVRSCLTWRDSIGTDHLMADEFSSELVDGVAYVAGHDGESRPVVMFRIKQDYQKFHSQKLFTRLVVFTLEVAIQTMNKNVEQFVILFDASFFRSASAFMNILLATLRMVADYYPGRLHKAFVIDPPSLVPYLWKGVRPFVELSALTSIVSSLDYEDSFGFNDFRSYPRAASLRFDPSSVPAAAAGKLDSCSSTRFSFTVSHHLDSVKPWYLSLTAASAAAKIGGPAISPLHGRSFSFASPAARGPAADFSMNGMRKSFFPSTPMPEKTQTLDPAMIRRPRTPKPSFLHSPAGLFFRKECHGQNRAERSREAFFPYLKFYRRPYDEMLYRSKMRPPLGGLISIVTPHCSRRHVSVSQRF